MNSLEEQLQGASSVAIAGHTKPDGDCVGSCLAAYNYIREYFPQVQADLYLEPIPNIFKFLQRSNEILHEYGARKDYDLLIVLDCGDLDRLGTNGILAKHCRRMICIDHHVSNEGFGDEFLIVPDASSTCELIFDLMEPGKITPRIAECLYVGIVHDTGVFQYSCTSSRTMRIAGFLMDTGIDFSKIVDKTYMEKTYEQNLILARALEKSKRYLNGQCIASVITKKDMEDCGALPKHLEGIVAALRATKDVEVAIFLYQKDEGEYKISLRASSDAVNVAEIAAKYGGGGHVRAAGASMKQDPDDCVRELVSEVETQLERFHERDH